MRKIFMLMSVSIILAGSGCGTKKEQPTGESSILFIGKPVVEKVIAQLADSLGAKHQFRIERGVNQVADLWRESDGSTADFEQFCKENFVA